MHLERRRVYARRSAGRCHQIISYRRWFANRDSHGHAQHCLLGLLQLQWSGQLQRSSQQLRWEPKDWAILQVWQQPVQRVVVGWFQRQCCMCLLQPKVRRWRHLLHPIYDRQRRKYHIADVDGTIDGR